MGRFRGIVDAAKSKLVLSTGATVRGSDTDASDLSGGLDWVASDEIPDAAGTDWVMPRIEPETLALLQFTSGSTADPKGVMITHGNLLHNGRAIERAFDIRRDGGNEIGVFWLPAYHDMGLVGAIVAPVLAGGTSILMAPEAFLRNPRVWLEAISKYRATISGGPTFGFDLCVDKIGLPERAGLDLSCWSVAFVGAEPVSARSLERFATAFGPSGFKSSAFYPCYGLAEATLLVTGPTRGQGAATTTFDEGALAKGRAVAIATGLGRTMVSVGVGVGGTDVAVVDLGTERCVPDGHVGEVWVAGGSVASGYWDDAAETRAKFGGRLDAMPGKAFLRTGDLGFVHDGQLYIAGRRDDVLIVRGLNHHPQDLEATARESHPLAGPGAAFSAPGRPTEVAMVLEAVRGPSAGPADDWRAVVRSVRTAVMAVHGIELTTITLVRAGMIPRTSSGKVRRRECQRALAAGELRPVYTDLGRATENAPVAAIPLTTAVVAHAAATTGTVDAKASVFAGVCQHALALGGAPMSQASPEMTLVDVGLDSLKRVDLAARLEKAFGCRLDDSDFTPSQTLGALAEAIGKRLTSPRPARAGGGEVPPEHFEFGKFPEVVRLKRYERMLKAVVVENPYFGVDEGGTGSGSVLRTGGRNRMNFCAYDYLGFSHHPSVAAAAKEAIDRYGSSAGASRLVSGEKQIHQELERELAAFLGTEAALAFVSGHATNVTTIGHLLGPEDLIVYDELAHNSIIQGAQLSGATRRPFPHNDAGALDQLLTDSRHRYRRVLIAIEGVYSMDGDFPELPRFVDLRRKHKALLLVDEAHSLGTMGATGRGVGEHFTTVRADVDLWMGTLSKSLASCGGYIAGSAEMIKYLGYTAPGFVYSVGLAPPLAAAALASLRLSKAQPERVRHLRSLAALFLELARERGLDTGTSGGTPVIPVIIGNSVKSMRLTAALLAHDINVQPILHPAVPEQAARLRFFINHNHSGEDIVRAVHAVADELGKL
jgi:8-amino-7-oxononanoate synthase